MRKGGRLLTIVITAVITFFVSSFIFTAFGNGYIRDFLSLNDDMAKFNKVRSLIDSMYIDIDEVDQERMMDEALYGYTYGVGDPYTEYYSAEEYASFDQQMEGSYVGVGIILNVNDKNQIEAESTYEDSPGEKAGVLPGDIILKVDGKEYDGEMYKEAVDRMRGTHIEEPKDTKVVLTIDRDGKNIDITVTRGEVVTSPVKWKMYDEGIGYIRLSMFDRIVNVHFADALEELQEGGMQKLIIDLRGNPGGDYDVVCDIADMLLPKCTIVYTEDKSGKKEYKNSDKYGLDMPMAVLVNDGSASASEILAGTLKVNEKAIIIGTKTFGKGVVQTIFPFEDGSGVKITTAKYYLPNGESIHGEGVKPDIEVKLPEETKKNIPQLTLEEDTQLSRAILELKK